MLYDIVNTSLTASVQAGNLDIYDFNLFLTNATNSYLSSELPLSISSNGTQYSFGINIIGDIYGGEELSIFPNSNSIFDSSGNVAITSNQINNVIELEEEFYLLLLEYL